jgi:OFA family oxalate/formate antiporter-like MFS transporter
MKTNRWAIAVAGVFLQIALGAVYAWSVFRVPLAKQFGWSISEVTLTFTIRIFVLGLASFFGGLQSFPRLGGLHHRYAAAA